MRKCIRYVMLLLCAVCLAGCNKQTEEKQSGTLKERYVSEDYKPWADDIMVTDTGFYYVSGRTEPGFHYYDPTTDRSMYLCNKPECRHDGNAFCVATNGRYSYLNYCIYSGKLFMYALEKTETQYLYKVLAAELDGSGMDEVATAMTVEKTDENVRFDHCSMMIHRNIAVLEMKIEGKEDKDVRYYGVALVNLNTGEVTYLDEEPLGPDNVEVTGLSGYGDWIYYCRKEGKKNLLHRYHITEKTDEVCKLLVGFSGDYAVKDEDTVLYLKNIGSSTYQENTGKELCSYRYSTKENKEEAQVMTVKQDRYNPEGTSGGTEPAKILDLQTDGEYFYIPEEWQRSTEDTKANVHVLNRELEEVAVVNIAEVLPSWDFEENGSGWRYSHTELIYCGEDIYWELCTEENTTESYIFRCKRSDFLAGEPKFEFVYRWNW